MYYLQRTKNKIQHFKVIDDDLLYKLNDNDYTLYKNDVLFDTENYGYFGFDKYLCLNHNGTTEFIEISSNIKTIIPATFTGDGFYENNFISSKNSIREGVGLYSSNYLICQLFPFKELYELPNRYYGSGNRIKNQYIQIQNESKIVKSLSLITGEYDWENDLSEKLGKFDNISKIFGIVNECLWAITERGVLLGINIANGNLIHHLNFDGYDTFQQYGTVQMQYFRSLYDEKQQLLIGFYEHRFWQIDLKESNPILKIENTKKINPVYYIEEFASPEGMAFDENYIYFRDNELATVGVLNRKTKKIEWQERLYDSPAVINDLQISTDKLYALDTMAVLHIFEKETIE